MNKWLLFFILFSQITMPQDECGINDKLIKDFKRTLYNQPDSSFYFINKAIDKFNNVNSKSKLAYSYYLLSNYYCQENDFKNAKKAVYNSLRCASQSKNRQVIVLCYNQLGLIERDNGNYEKSLSLFLEALKLSERNKLTKDKCSTLSNLGILYELQKDTLKALDCYKKTIQIAERNNFKDILLYNYTCLGIINRRANKKESIENYTKALKIADESNDFFEKASILLNLSDIYLASKNANDFDKAYQYLQEVKKGQTWKDNDIHKFYYYFNIGAYYCKVKKHTTAILMYEEALKLSKNGIDDEQKINLYKSLSRVYKDINDLKNAYLYQEKYFALQENVFSVEKSKGFNEIQTKYEVEKKNLKIDLLSKEKLIESNKKKLMLYVSIALFLALLLLFLFFHQRFKTQKIILEKENLLHQNEKERLNQEQEIKWIKGVVEGQDQERNRIAKEIHDGIGGVLAGIKLELSQYNSEVKNKKIEKIVSQMSDAFQNLRSISHNLSLNTLKNKDLESLLNELKEEYESRNEFVFHLSIFPEKALMDLSDNIKHQIYRIVQELLANVSKHANAKNVVLNFTKHEDFLNIIVEDDGKGFDSNVEKGIGINNIIERLSSIQSTYTIESVKEKGTVITIDIPNL